MCSCELFGGSAVEILLASVVAIPGQLTTVLLPVIRYTSNVDNAFLKYIYEKGMTTFVIKTLSIYCHISCNSKKLCFLPYPEAYCKNSLWLYIKPI